MCRILPNKLGLYCSAFYVMYYWCLFPIYVFIRPVLPRSRAESCLVIIITRDLRIYKMIYINLRTEKKIALYVQQLNSNHHLPTKKVAMQLDLRSTTRHKIPQLWYWTPVSIFEILPVSSYRHLSEVSRTPGRKRHALHTTHCNQETPNNNQI